MPRGKEPTPGRGNHGAIRDIKYAEVPKFSDQQLVEINGGLKSNLAEVRAATIVSLLGRVLPAIPERYEIKVKDVDSWKNANGFVYEVIGGLNRHALWADENPGEFYKQAASTFAAVANNNIVAQGSVTVVTGVPASALDDDSGDNIIDAEVKE